MINGLQSITPNVNISKQSASLGKAQAHFANVLKTAINDMNSLQNLSDAKTAQLAAGKIDNLHDVMVTAQKASIVLETGVQIQRKVIDAYNEIMRMQI